MRHSTKLVLLAAALLVSCDSADHGDTVSAGAVAGDSHLAVHLTDAPIDMAGVASVVVVIDEVTVYPEALMDGEDSPPISILGTLETFDLLTLTGGATDLLAEADLPAGLYNRIRIGIEAARLTFVDSTEVDLKIDSHKVDVTIPFELIVGADMVIVLDFDAGASIQVNETGSDTFILRPVIQPL